MKKILAMLLAVIMMFSFMSVSFVVFAEDSGSAIVATNNAATGEDADADDDADVDADADDGSVDLEEETNKVLDLIWAKFYEVLMKIFLFFIGF